VDFLSQVRWRPTIGDPGFMGWFTVWAYAACAVLAAVAALRAGDRRVPESRMKLRVVWFLVALLMGFLCINKQLDLQSLLTDLGRAAAKQEGWYGHRRGVQQVFVFCVLGGAGAFTAGLATRFRSFWASHALLLIGLIFTLTFIVVRAISFHHVDQFLHLRFEGLKLNWILELTGIALVTAAAVVDLARLQR